MENNLSKPVAYDYQIASACIADGHNENGKWVDWNNKLTRHCPPDWMMEEGKVTGLKLLYSQKYVSALLAELEAKDKRIAELERANTSQDDHINQQQDRIDSLEKTNTGLGRRLGDAEKRLATPVRLLGEMLVHDWEHRVDRQAAFEHRKIAWDARMAEDKKAILAAGFTFTVEGDEQ